MALLLYWRRYDYESVIMTENMLNELMKEDYTKIKLFIMPVL